MQCTGDLSERVPAYGIRGALLNATENGENLRLSVPVLEYFSSDDVLKQGPLLLLCRPEPAHPLEIVPGGAHPTNGSLGRNDLSPDRLPQTEKNMARSLLTKTLG